MHYTIAIAKSDSAVKSLLEAKDNLEFTPVNIAINKKHEKYVVFLCR